MVYLRHHGFPSPLIDWSYSPYVAAFFAFRDDSAGKPEKRSIYAYCESPEGVKGGALGERTIRPIGPYVRSQRGFQRLKSIDGKDAHIWTLVVQCLNQGRNRRPILFRVPLLILLYRPLISRKNLVKYPMQITGHF